MMGTDATNEKLDGDATPKEEEPVAVTAPPMPEEEAPWSAYKVSENCL